MLFYNLHILKVPDIVELKTAIIMFKAFHNLLPLNVQQFFLAYMNQFIQLDRNVILYKNMHVPV